MPDDNVARVHVEVRPRCFGPAKNPRDSSCGELATHLRPSGNGFPLGYFCADHKQPGDQPIPDSFVIPRVSVTMEVLLSGTSWAAGLAKSEAVDRLILAIQRVYGVPSLVTVTSTPARFEPLPRPGGRRLKAGKGQ
jgi:hypothetical protein